MAARVQVQDLPAPQDIRPTQSTGDSFGGAERPDQNENYSRLAEALGMAAKVANQFQRQENKSLERDAYAYIAGKDRQELAGEFKRGAIPNMNHPSVAPIIGGQVGKADAERLVQDHMVKVRAGVIPAFDDSGTPTNMWEPLARDARVFLKNNPAYQRYPEYAKAFQGVIDSNEGAIRGIQQEKRVEHFKRYIQGGLAGGMDSLIREAGNQEVADDAVRNVWQRFRSELRERGAKAGVDIPWRELDDSMIGRLKENADKHPEAVLRLLNLDRGVAQDGTKLGALSGVQERYQDVLHIRERASAEMEKRVDVQAKESAVQAAEQAMLRGDLSLNQLTDHAYENPWTKKGADPNRTIKAEEIRKEAETRFMTRRQDAWHRQGLSAGLAAMERLKTETEIYVNNNRENPRWKALISDAVTIYGNPSAVTEDAKMARLMEAKSVYDHLKTNNPGYLDSTLKPSEKDNTFFSMVDVYQNYRGIPEREAFRRAAAFIQNPPEPLDRGAQKDISDRVNALDLNGWAWGSGRHQNQFSTKQAMTKVALTIASDRDISPSDAVKAASEIVQKRSVALNGVAISGNPYVFPQNVQHWQTRLDEIAKKYGHLVVTLSGVGGISSGSELSVRPMEGGKYFAVIHAKTGEPLVIPKVGPDGKHTTPQPLLIDPKEIMAIEKDVEAKNLGEISAEQSLAADKADLTGPGRRDVARRLKKAPGNTPAEKAAHVNQEIVERRQKARKALDDAEAGQMTDYLQNQNQQFNDAKKRASDTVGSAGKAIKTWLDSLRKSED